MRFGQHVSFISRLARRADFVYLFILSPFTVFTVNIVTINDSCASNSHFMLWSDQFIPVEEWAWNSPSALHSFGGARRRSLVYSCILVSSRLEADVNGSNFGMRGSQDICVI
jgi:hypothetical protein